MSGKVLVLNGVNLGALGSRRPEVYGSQTLEDIERYVRSEFPGADLEFRQTDYEGELVGWIQASSRAGAAEREEALVLNPGAWTHYSYALHDALEAAEVPKIEVHLSNIHAREPWRRHSVISPAVDAVVAGMGMEGYRAAVSYALSRLGER